MKDRGKHEGPLKINMKFDDAIKLSLAVKPPSEGWAEYEKRLKAEKPKRKPKRKTPA